MKYKKICEYCKSEFFTDDKRNKYCSLNCYHQSRKGKPWGGALKTGKGSHGKYSDFQVNRMATAKKAAYREFVLQHFEEYNIKRVEYIIENSYVQTLSAVIKMMNYPTNLKGKNGNFNRNWFAELNYAFEIDNYKLKFNEIYLPECYRKMTPEQLNSFRDILKESKNWYDFLRLFQERYKEIGITGKSGEFKNVLEFVQKTNFETHALNKNLTKNLSGCGSSLEIKMQNILNELKLIYVSQPKLENKEYKVESESVIRHSYLRPDFIINERLILEVNGDYWHGWNSRIEDMDMVQQQRVKDDWDKYNFYRKYNYSYIVVWEHELNNKENIENIKNRILLEVKNAEHNERIIYK